MKVVIAVALEEASVVGLSPAIRMRALGPGTSSQVATVPACMAARTVETSRPSMRGKPSGGVGVSCRSSGGLNGS
jgi:hypothetical protein